MDLQVIVEDLIQEHGTLTRGKSMQHGCNIDEENKAMGAFVCRPNSCAVAADPLDGVGVVFLARFPPLGLHDPLMGWTSSADMRQQLRLSFATRDEAVAFAERNAIAYRVVEPERRKTRKKNYADNFRFDRVT